MLLGKFYFGFCYETSSVTFHPPPWISEAILGLATFHTPFPMSTPLRASTLAEEKQINLPFVWNSSKCEQSMHQSLAMIGVACVYIRAL
ncbi:unnamed protein product [Protopolystoma xenopodis]|uniref:Uncharacterized protein n=1 Tax=Protopolystoma xenopodis TaxID=117903 RepID=A0A3S5AEY2_9PLAT|nr:unnamed protein product [Protopolystoma xenopodis]